MRIRMHVGPSFDAFADIAQGPKSFRLKWLEHASFAVAKM
jgi:hypothetical protein